MLVEACGLNDLFAYNSKKALHKVVPDSCQNSFRSEWKDYRRVFILSEIFSLLPLLYLSGIIHCHGLFSALHAGYYKTQPLLPLQFQVVMFSYLFFYRL